MRFFYDSRTDILGIRFKPGKPEPAARRQEVSPGVIMDFDLRNQLSALEVQKVSRQQPDLPRLMNQLVQELIQRSGELSQEVLLAIEKTLRLGDDPTSKRRTDYQPCFSFDAVANVLVVEFLRPTQGTELMPKQQILPAVWAVFDTQGQLVVMEMHSAVQQFPDLQRFVEQGQEMLAAQRFFRGPHP